MAEELPVLIEGVTIQIYGVHAPVESNSNKGEPSLVARPVTAPPGPSDAFTELSDQSAFVLDLWTSLWSDAELFHPLRDW